MKIRSRLLTKLVAAIAVVIVKLLFRTCRVRAHGDVEGISPYEGTGDRRYLYCIWHDQLMMTVFTGRPQNMAGLVSQHQDGSYLADALKMVGITPVRGSTNRGGARAMRELLDTIRQLHVAITPDGPRGPRHELKQGLVFLASHGGRSIVATAYTCRRCWRIKGSWTDMMIPKPFTTIYIRATAPMEIPPRLKRDGLQEYTDRLQAEMERMEAEVEMLAQGKTLAEVCPAAKRAA